MRMAMCAGTWMESSDSVSVCECCVILCVCCDVGCSLSCVCVMSAKCLLLQVLCAQK